MIVISLGNGTRRLINWAKSLRDVRRRKEETWRTEEEYLQDIKKAGRDLEIARNNYNFAENPALLECYIYEIKAAEQRLDYCLKSAKAAGIKMHFSPRMLLSEKRGGESV